MRVCIVTPGQPSNNPRFVKEADALAEAGHTVHAVCSDCGLWPSAMDAGLMTDKRWTMEYGGGRAWDHPWRFRAARLRHGVSRRIVQRMPTVPALQQRAAARAAPEIERAAVRFPADLYIAHHPSVLPIAARAARLHGARLGYDVEDLYTSMTPYVVRPTRLQRWVQRVETTYLPRCSYVTAASPEFADVYVARYGVARPIPVLNVFPLADRPLGFRPTATSGPIRLYWFSQAIGRDRGLEDVVRAVGLAGDGRFEIHLRGNWRDGYKDELFATANAAGVRRRAIKLSEPAPPADMVRLAAQFDVGLSLEQPTDESRSFCITNKTFVYLLAGNAVASTNLPGQQRVIDSIGRAAFSYSAGDVRALADGLMRWHDNRAALDAARREAWTWAAKRYNWDIEKRTFLETIDRACGGPSRSELWRARA